MASGNGNATPRARTPITPYPGADTAAVRELLVMMKSTLGTLWVSDSLSHMFRLNKYAISHQWRDL